MAIDQRSTPGFTGYLKGGEDDAWTMFPDGEQQWALDDTYSDVRQNITVFYSGTPKCGNSDAGVDRAYSSTVV